MNISFDPAQSPYSKDFENILDQKIKKVILGLVKNGYLTAYSCEGHSFLEPRYVVLCFGSKEQRTLFYKNIASNWIRILFPIQLIDSLAFEEIRGTKYEYQTRENEVRGLNHIFGRNYESYCFLKITIGFEYSHKQHPLKQPGIWIFNALTRSLLTKYLEFRVKKLPFFYL